MAKNEGATGAQDPRGLILEAYRIADIGPEDCRSIYFDWAIGGASGRDLKADTEALLAHHGAAAPDHPMTAVLREGLDSAKSPKRRGGRKARV